VGGRRRVHIEAALQSNGQPPTMFAENTMDFISLVMAAQEQGGNPGDFFYSLWPPLILMAVLFYLMVIRPERKRRSETEKMLSELKKNDRVVTIGGIYGTIVNAPKDASDITIKVDESTNTRLRILRSSVSRVLTTENATDEKKDTV
jgi:preprotein translocase subunit YajC